MYMAARQSARGPERSESQESTSDDFEKITHEEAEGVPTKFRKGKPVPSKVNIPSQDSLHARLHRLRVLLSPQSLRGRWEVAQQRRKTKKANRKGGRRTKKMRKRTRRPKQRKRRRTRRR